ncbi:MAG: helix-turn-helix domain-containing protein [Bacteroidales bacterium]
MFISVKEAMELTGLSSTTIYRLCNKRINTLFIRKEENKFLIDKDYLLATYPPDIVKITEQLENEPVLTGKIENTPILEIKNTPESSKIENNVIEFDVSNETEHNAEQESGDFEPELIVDETFSETQQEVIFAKENVELEKNFPFIESPTVESGNPAKQGFNWETLAGISISMVLICLLIYLIYLEIG